MSSPQSIYAAPVRASGRKSRDARCAQQQRAEARRTAALQGGPARRLDRLGPLLALLRRYRESGPDPLPGSPLATFVQELGTEVDGLEAWVRAQPRAQQRAGAVIRQALDFLRDFGRLTVLDFSSVPEEDRPHLVTLLALEHRWCYARGRHHPGGLQAGHGADRRAMNRLSGRSPPSRR